MRVFPAASTTSVDAPAADAASGPTAAIHFPLMLTGQFSTISPEYTLTTEPLRITISAGSRPSAVRINTALSSALHISIREGGFFICFFHSSQDFLRGYQRSLHRRPVA